MTYTERALQIRSVIEKASQSLDDSTALTAVELFPNWKALVENAAEVSKGFRFQYDGNLYRVEQPEYKFAEHYVPGSIGTESLFSVVDESHKGTVEDPIPYQTNMEIYNGLYYLQHGVMYYCFRDSGNPLYHDLSLLIGVYVEIVNV